LWRYWALILVRFLFLLFWKPVSYIKTLSIMLLGLNFIHMMIEALFRKLENEKISSS
jgi:hypothetical protein